MRNLILKISLLLTTSILLTGCLPAKIDDVPTEEREAWFWAQYCTVEEQRRWTQFVYDFRRAEDGPNLALDHSTNDALKKHCKGEKE
jgi:hypothetical protein